jgi:hypothetical protein
MKLVITEEEKKRIKSLYTLSEQVPALSPEDMSRLEDKRKEKLKSTYPNYCKYKKYTVYPKGIAGVSGDDLFIKGHCMYKQPAEGSIDFETSGIWLPHTGDTRINFWDQPKREEMYKLAEKYVKHVGGKIDSKTIREQINNIFRDGLVHAFAIDGNVWKPSLTYAPDYFRLSSAGYFINQDKNSKYKNPAWEDERSDYERFIDEYGIALQLCAAAITLLLQPLLAPMTGGASLILWIEIAAELGIGLPVALREYQRGDYVDSSFSFLTSVLPFLKLTKGFANIKMETWRSLSRTLKNAPPPNATPSQFAEWLSKMDIEDRKLLNELLHNNAYQLEKLLSELEQSIPNYLSVGLKNDIKLAFKNNPELSNKFKSWNTLPGRELVSNILVLGPGLIIQAVWGDEINAQDAGKLDKIWKKIPEQYKPEFYEIVMSSPESAKKLANDEAFNKVVDTGVKSVIDSQGSSIAKNIAIGFTKALNTQGRDTLGSEYIETGVDGTEGLNKVSKTPEELDSLSKQGWYINKDFDPTWGWSEVLEINGDLWFKKIEPISESKLLTYLLSTSR